MRRKSRTFTLQHVMCFKNGGGGGGGGGGTSVNYRWGSQTVTVNAKNAVSIGKKLGSSQELHDVTRQLRQAGRGDLELKVATGFHGSEKAANYFDNWKT